MSEPTEFNEVSVAEVMRKAREMREAGIEISIPWREIALQVGYDDGGNPTATLVRIKPEACP